MPEKKGSTRENSEKHIVHFYALLKHNKQHVSGGIETMPNEIWPKRTN